MNAGAIAGLIADLVRAGTSPELVGRVAEALVDASRGLSAGGVRRGRPGDATSAGAMRTRAWRARRAVAAGAGAPVTSQSAFVTPVVTPPVAVKPRVEPPEGAKLRAFAGIVGVDESGARHMPGVTNATVVTICDAAPKKETPPHPHKKNIPPISPHRGRQRHKSADVPLGPPVDRSKPDRRGRLWVAASDPVYLDLEAHSPTRSLPGGGDGWWFSPAAIAAAQARLGRKVAVLSVAGRDGGEGATGPPQQQAG